MNDYSKAVCILLDGTECIIPQGTGDSKGFICKNLHMNNNTLTPYLSLLQN